MTRPVTIKTPAERSRILERILDKTLSHVLKRLQSKPCEFCKLKAISASELSVISNLLEKNQFSVNPTPAVTREAPMSNFDAELEQRRVRGEAALDALILEKQQRDKEEDEERKKEKR